MHCIHTIESKAEMLLDICLIYPDKTDTAIRLIIYYMQTRRFFIHVYFYPYSNLNVILHLDNT